MKPAVLAPLLAQEAQKLHRHQRLRCDAQVLHGLLTEEAYWQPAVGVRPKLARHDGC